MTTPRHSVSVAAAVLNPEGQALVIQRRDNHAWQLPGGILELDEAIHDGLVREVVEETGVTVRPDRLTGVYKNMNLGVVALVFRATPADGTPRPTEESAAVEWWKPEQISQHMDEAFAVRILDAISDRPAPAIRAHDGTNLLDDPYALPAGVRATDMRCLQALLDHNGINPAEAAAPTTGEIWPQDATADSGRRTG